MKKLLLIFTLLFSTLMFSTPSYGEWTKVSENVNGNTFYVDFERIRKHSGYVYFWRLVNFLKPTEFGHLSTQVYIQLDCKLFREKSLSFVQHKQPMGRGSADSEYNYTPKNPEWTYPPPATSLEEILKRVCSQ